VSTTCPFRSIHITAIGKKTKNIWIAVSARPSLCPTNNSPSSSSRFRRKVSPRRRQGKLVQWRTCLSSRSPRVPFHADIHTAIGCQYPLNTTGRRITQEDVKGSPFAIAPVRWMSTGRTRRTTKCYVGRWRSTLNSSYSACAAENSKDKSSDGGQNSSSQRLPVVCS